MAGMLEVLLGVALMAQLIILVLLERMQRIIRTEWSRWREEVTATARDNRLEISQGMQTLTQVVAEQMRENSRQLYEMTLMNERRLEGIRQTMEGKLEALREDNARKLEQMRLTVDEKLHATLERRLGESFRQVSERLEQVHQGLGEMQSLAAGVGDLKRVLSNVKARGTLGEIQLEAMLEQIMTAEQYARHVPVVPGSRERVDFAIRLPGKEDGEQIWLPIDAKFPLEDYQRLVEAQESGDSQGAAEASKALVSRLKQEAKSISQKYIQPPHTTDFAILYLPVEGLFAEAMRTPGLWEVLQREYKVVLTGPTTLSALLNSLQMGFRTLAIQRRSGEVWQLLGAVKAEFGKFGDILEKTKRKLLEASNSIEGAAVRTRAIERHLRGVEALSEEEAQLWIEKGEAAGGKSQRGS